MQTLRYAYFHNLEDVDAPVSFVSAKGLLDAISAGALHAAKLPSFQIARKSHGSTTSESAGQHEFLAPPLGPDPTDRTTIINLAKMTSDSYVQSPDETGWLNTSMPFNYSSSFGWSTDGLRGHIFSDTYNNTVIVSFKGTTVDPREKYYSSDRFNDNLLFSCCCAAQRPDPYPYGTVCGCNSAVYTCNETCITSELAQEGRYYPVAMSLMMHNVTRMYPGADYWVIGHSMGGAVASLIGLTWGLPTVTFEAPGNELPAIRLGLDPDAGPPVYHFGNTADPVFMGACNGWSSSCGVAGYAFESQCFTGKRCVYDTVGDFGWHLSIANHRINTVIPEVLEKYNETASCAWDDECVDCAMWNFNVTQRGAR